MSELAHLLKSVVDVIDEHDGACDGEPTVRMSSMGIELLRRALGAYLDRPRSEAAKLPDEVEAMPESPSTFGCGHCGVTNRFEPRPAARARFSSMTPEEQKRWIDTGEAWPRRPDATHVFAADAVPDDVRRAHDIVRPCPGEAPRAPKTGLEGFDKWAAPMDGKHLLGHMVGQRTYPFTETAEYIDPPAGSFLDGFQYARQLRRERASRVSETTGKCATCHATGRNLTDGKQCPAEGCPAAPNACAEGPRDATLERVQAWLLEHGDCAGHEYDLCALVDAAIAAIAPIGRLSNTRVVDESPLTFDPEPLTAEKAKALLLEGRELRRHVEEGYDRVAREPADRPCVTCAVEPALPGKLHCAGHEAGSWATPIPCVEPVFGLLRSSWTATLDLAAQNADWRLVDEVRHEMAGRQPLGPRTLLDPAMATADSSSYAPPVVKTAHTIALIEQVRRETLDGAAAVFDSHAAAYENCSSPEAYCGAASQLRGVATQLRAMAAEKGSVTK
jgi:hypothetical protein